MNARTPRFVSFGLAAVLTAQVFTPGPQVSTFLSAVDDSDQPYALYLPKSFSPRKKYPLVISLHGAGSNHRLNLRRVFGQGNRPGESDAQATRYFPALKEVDLIVASPLARGTMGYQGIAEKDVYDVLEDVKKQFPIDEDRVYLTGLSMGGGGTLWLGLTRPDVWAAIAPVCPAPPPGIEPLAGNALNLPVKLFHGAADPVVPVAQSREWRRRLTEAGVKVEYVEYPGVRHNSWDQAYKDGAIFDWFARFERVRYPERVRFSSASYEYARAYWVTLDRLTPGRLASIDARFEGKGSIVVETKDLDAFTLVLKGHPLAPAKSRVRVRIDGAEVAVKGGDGRLAFHRTEKGWTAGPGKPEAGEKGPGAEGPIAAALGGRHIYVYGTAGAADEEEIARRRAMAAQAADWSPPRSRLSLNLRVASDKEIGTEERKEAHLVLFGTRETNTVLARLAASLPAHLNPGAADYGLVYVYPAEGRYVVVSSGLPWWTRLDQARRPGLPFIAAPYRTLQSFGDFILFKGGLDNVVVEGRFDRKWKFPPEAAAKLRATGAVEVRP